MTLEEKKAKEEACNAEIKSVLEKHGCSLKVSALIETDGTHFKVETVCR